MEVKKEDRISIEYRERFEDDQVFDSSLIVSNCKEVSLNGK